MERAPGVEPGSSGWKPDASAARPCPHDGGCGEIRTLNQRLKRPLRSSVAPRTQDLVPPAGVEPAPLRLKGGCSPLSYGGMTGERAVPRARANERWHAATAARSPSCHCYSVVKERTAYPCGQTVGAAGTRTQLSSMATALQAVSVSLPSTSPTSGAASGIRTRVLAMAERDPSAERWPRTRGASGRP